MAGKSTPFSGPDIACQKFRMLIKGGDKTGHCCVDSVWKSGFPKTRGICACGTNQGGYMNHINKFTIIAVSFLFLCGAVPAFAGGVAPDQELSDLKAQMRVMMERIKQLEAQRGQDNSAQVEALQKKVDDLEAYKKEASQSKAYWKNGFRIEYKPNDSEYEYKMRIRAGIQFRYTYVNTDNDVPVNRENYSSLIGRRLRLFVDGTAPTKDWKYFMHIQLEPKGKVNTHDAFIQWQKYKYARVQFGRMKIPYNMEYWQSGFAQNGADRTIFTGDSEADKDVFGNKVYDIPGSNARLRVGGHLDKNNGFPTGGMLLYRSQGINLNGYVDMLGMKQFLAYWAGIYNGRDTQGATNGNADMLYVGRVGINFLSGSDPKGPLGPKGLNNYFMQGDYGYNTKPLASFVMASFYNRATSQKYYDRTGTAQSYEHDTDNYGFNGCFLFRYMGFSADLEAAWEEFIQAPGKSDYEQTWDRWGARANLGYFIVPRKWELTFKFAHMNRLDDANAINSVQSGLGLVELDDGYAIEKDMQQYRAGINWYLHGFNQYISAEVGLFHRNFDRISATEAAIVGVTPSDAKDSQDDIRFRIQYQHFF